MTANHRRLLALLSLLASSPVVAQSAWTKAPALPTACYGEQDSHGAALENAMKEMDAARAKLSAANRALVKQIFANPATLQQGLMSAMQKNPAKAQEIMNFMQSQGAGLSQAAVGEASQKASAFDEKKTKLKAAYQAEKDALLGPIYKRIMQHTTELGGTAADDAIVKAGRIEYNTKYETIICARYFGKDIPALLAEYRAYQVNDIISKGIENEASISRMLELFGVPAGRYQSEAEMSGVVKYLQFAIELFALRRIMASTL